MFAEVKESLPVMGDDYDAQIIREIKACALDLTTSTEIVLPGEISITRSQDPQSGAWTVTDSSTLKDELITTAISIWCNMRIGNPPNYDRLNDAYETQKVQLMHAAGYTDYGEDEEDAEE